MSDESFPADAKEPMGWALAVLSAALGTVEAQDAHDPRALVRASEDLSALIEEADAARIVMLAGVGLEAIKTLAETEGATAREWLQASGLHVAEAS